MCSEFCETMSAFTPNSYACLTYRDCYNKYFERSDSYLSDTKNAEKVPKLKEIACFNVAIALWNHVDVPERVNRHVDPAERRFNDMGSELQDDAEFKNLHKLSLPKPIKDQIVEYFHEIREQIDSWVWYHFRKVFFNYKNADYVYYHVHHLVWHSNGTINCKETAKNLMNSLLVSEVEKYYFLCTYCMKEDFQRLSPLLRTNNVVDALNFYDYPLIYYWKCYFKNTLNQIPLGGGESIDKFMLQCDGIDNWPAKEYFFDNLTSDEQIECAIWLIAKYKVKYQKLVLIKLNETQRLAVYMDKGVEIFFNYVNSTRFPIHKTNHRDIMMTWCEIRNIITQDQFVLIFNELLPFERNEPILKDIWINSCNDFKHHLINCEDNKIVKIIIQSCSWSWLKDGLFYSIIRDADTLSTKNITQTEFFFEFCEKLINEMKFPILARILNSCFPQPPQSVQFRQQLVDRDFFTKYCVDLIIKGETSTLDKLLNSWLPKVNESEKEFKRNLTKKSYFETRCKKFITNNELVMSDLLINSCLSQMQERQTFKELLTTKKFFIEHCEKLITNGGNGAVTMLNGMLCWSLISGKKIAQFKRDLVTNSKTFKNQFLNFSTLENFQELDDLLFELLSSEDFVSEYKRNTLTSVEGVSECSKLFDCDMSLLNEIVSDCFPDANEAAQFRRLIILSPSVGVKLRRSRRQSISRSVSRLGRK